MSAALSVSVEFVYAGECCTCGVPMALTEAIKKERRRSHENFYCPNGHAQHYPGESTEERLKKQLDRATKEKEWAEQASKTARHAEAVAKGKLKAQSERVKNGVCPCCKRSFTNLRRHMASKHPKFTGTE